MVSPADQPSGESSQEAPGSARVSLLQVVQGLDPPAEARAIALAVRHFNHNDASLHDYEVSLGSASSLLRLLDRALRGGAGAGGDDAASSILVEAERAGEGRIGGGGGDVVGGGIGNLHRWRSARIAMTCSALEMTLRCSAATLRSRFLRPTGSGAPMMPALVGAVEEFAASSGDAAAGRQTGNAARLVLRSCAKIWRRLTDAGVPLADGEGEVRTVMSLLVRILAGGEGGGGGGGGEASSGGGTDADAFATVANLAGGHGAGGASRHREVIATYPGLLDVLLTAAPSSSSSSSSRRRAGGGGDGDRDGRRRHCACEAARALRNLSRCARSRAAMGGRGDVAEALASWAGDRSRPAVRRFAVAAARNLSCSAPGAPAVLAVHHKKLLVGALLRSLRGGGGSGADAATDASSLRAVRGLIDRERPAVVAECLVDAVRTATETNDAADFIAADWCDAAATLLGPVGLLDLPELSPKSQAETLDALARLSAGPGRGPCAVGVAGALESLSSAPRNRPVMVRHDGLLSALAKLLRRGDDLVASGAAACVRTLLSAPEHGLRLWDDGDGDGGGGGEELRGTILDAVSGAADVGDGARELCVRTVASLVAGHASHRRRLARCRFLVPSLVKFVAGDGGGGGAGAGASDDAKRAAVEAIVRLSRTRLAERGDRGGPGDADDSASCFFAGFCDEDTEWMDFAPDMFLEIEI